MTQTKSTWQEFVDRIAPRAQELGLSVEVKAGWVNVYGPGAPATRHRVCIERADGRLPRVETTLDLPADLPDVVSLVRDNGAIRCRLLPTPSTVAAALEAMCDPETPPPLRRKGGRAAGSPGASLDSLLADVGKAPDA